MSDAWNHLDLVVLGDKRLHPIQRWLGPAQHEVVGAHQGRNHLLGIVENVREAVSLGKAQAQEEGAAGHLPSVRSSFGPMHVPQQLGTHDVHRPGSRR